MLEFIFNVLILVIFFFVVVLALSLYKGKFGISVPYFVMSSFILLGMVILEFLNKISPSILSLTVISEVVQILQIAAGIFLILGLYKIFESRFALDYWEVGK